jgi:hypothetical protein
MLKKNIQPGRISRLVADLSHMVGGIPLNDPTTPDLRADLEAPMMGALRYAVRGLTMQTRNENERRALNCHVSTGVCINALQSLMRKPVHSWSATKLLEVVPAAGAEMNAYYDRRSLRFFYYNHKGNNVYFGDSVDIIAHELGHAFLDAMRPDFWSVQALEIWSFHEAFSDIVAVFNLLNHDMVIKAVLEETNGDLRVSNHASRLAEEVGKLIRAVTNDPAYLPDALRNPAVERFHYVKPSSLPKETSNDRLAAECHSFGRVFSAAWYEALVRCYELETSSGMAPEAALKKARDACMSIVLKGVAASPRVANYYEAAARCMVSVASDHGESYARSFSDVFSEWKIIGSEPLKALSHRSWSDVVRDLGRGDSVVKTKHGSIISMKRRMTIKASELPGLSSLSLPNNVEFEAAFDSYYEFDKSGSLVGEIAPDKDAVLEDAAECMSQVYGELGAEGMWELNNGKIQRRHIR